MMFATAYAQGWEEIPSETTANITGVSFCSPDTGHFVTQAGEIGVSFDAGRSWMLFPVAEGVVLEDVFFVNRDTGMVCGRGGTVYRTVDGGRSWADVSIDNKTPWLLSVYMSSGSEAIVLGMTREQQSPLRGLSLFTTDGGRTWQKQESRGMAYGEIFEAADGDLYHQSWGKLHLSKDGGKTWKSKETGNEKPGRVIAVADSVGIRAGNNGMCRLSTDNGKTWKSAKVRTDCHYTAVTMFTPDHIFLGGSLGALLETTNGGEDWKSQTLTTPFNIYDMAEAGDYLVVVGADGHIVRSKVR